jgi:hypothetical protein
VRLDALVQASDDGTPTADALQPLLVELLGANTAATLEALSLQEPKECARADAEEEGNGRPTTRIDLLLCAALPLMSEDKLTVRHAAAQPHRRPTPALDRLSAVFAGQRPTTASGTAAIPCCRPNPSPPP